MKKVLINLLFLLGLITFGCSEEDSPFSGTDNNLLAFNLTASDGTRYAGVITGNKLVVTVPYNVSLSGSTADYSICELATISPDPSSVTDWESDQTFVVTSYNNTKKEYYYELNRSQVSSTDNVTLATQADVEAFAKSGISIVNGDLIIGSNSSDVEDPVTDLSSLSNLTSVKQNIFVYSSFAGKSLKGLENITTAAGLYIGSKSSTVNTADTFDIDLPSLKSLGSLVVNSATIKSLSLPKVEDIGYFLLYVPNVEEMNFSSLASCHTDFIMNGTSVNSVMSQIDFPALKSVGGLMTLNYYAAETVTFPKLETVGSALNISFMRGWKNMSFPELKQINGELYMISINSLDNLSMPKLEIVNGRFYFDMSRGNPALKSVSFDALKEVNGSFTFYFSGYSEMETLSFPALEKASDNITFQSNSGDETLKTLSLPSLKQTESVTVYGLTGVKSLDFSSCEELNSIYLITPSGLTDLKTPKVLTNFTINAGSQSLSPMTITGLEEVTNTFDLSSLKNNNSVTVGSIKKIETFRFTDSNLKSLSMPDLEEINSLTIQTYNLQSLHMDKLVCITGDCTFTSTRDLTDDGLSFASLKTIGGALSISGFSTPVLTTLKGFAALESAGSVSIKNMTNLTDFSALKNVANSLSSGWTTSGNAYNPTLSDMQNGNYVKE